MDIKKRKKKLFNIVKQMCVEDNRKKLSKINVSSVLKTLK